MIRINLRGEIKHTKEGYEELRENRIVVSFMYLLPKYPAKFITCIYYEYII